MNPDDELAHELAHHNSMNFANVDAEGNMKVIDKHDAAKQGITGFGMGTSNKEGLLSPADQFVNMFNKHKDKYGIPNYESLRGELYNKVMNNVNNKQRPELKQGLATALDRQTAQSILGHLFRLKMLA